MSRDPAGRWDVFALAPTPHDVGLGLTPGEARRALSAARPQACAHPDDVMLRSFFERLGREGYSPAHPATDPVPNSTQALPTPQIGSPPATRGIPQCSPD